ncbi:MAG TPA: CoA-transferase [Thermoplasmata archaeon]|nr:CoA-transferase [Thermoplasmata archaeon]
MAIEAPPPPPSAESGYKRTELMAICAAREIRDGEIAFIGTGLPMLGGMLAKATHAPNCIMVFESGVVDARPKRTPLSIGDACLVPGSVMLGGLTEVFGLLMQPGHVDVGFIGAAQIDRFGNLNTTVIGDYRRPKVRLPGSGGGNDIGSLAKRTIVMMKQDARKFVEKVDYVTTPGWVDGPGGRERVGLPRGGPSAVITDLGVYRFEPETREMVLDSTHPGVTVQDVKANVSWDIRVPSKVRTTKRPTKRELRILRTKLDPDGIFLGGV